MRVRRRSTRVLVDQTFLESLRAMERLYISGGGGAGKASGEDESLIPAASSGVVITVHKPRGWYTNGDSTQGIPASGDWGVPGFTMETGPTLDPIPEARS